MRYRGGSLGTESSNATAASRGKQAGPAGFTKANFRIAGESGRKACNKGVWGRFGLIWLSWADLGRFGLI